MTSLSFPNNENELPDVPYFPIPDIKWRSKADKPFMTRKVIAAAFFSYVVYNPEGRYLDRVEVTAMIRTRFCDKRTAIVHQLFEIFDDPNSTLTMRLRPWADESNHSQSWWWLQVDSWLEELRRKEPEFQVRARALRGMKGKVGHLEDEGEQIEGQWLPTLCGKRLEEYQLCRIHAFNHWFKDPQGEPIPLHDRVAMIIDCLNLDGKPTKDNGKPSPVAKKIRSLAEDEDSLNRAVRKLAEPKKDHFGHQAWEVVTSYANGKYKGWFPEPPKLVTGNDPVQGVTISMAGTILHAIAPNPDPYDPPSSDTQGHPVQNPSKSKANNTRDATAPGSSQASWGRDSMAHGHGQPAARPTLPPPAPFKARMPDQVLQTNATASVLNQPHNAWDPVVYGTGPPALERGQPARGTALQPYQSDQPRSYNSIPGSSASSREQKSGSKAKDKDTKKSSEKEKKRHRETDPESSREEERQVPRKHPGDPYNRRQRQ